MQTTVQESVRTAASDSRVKEHSNTRSRFFVTMAVLLLVIVVVGFAPSFYFKIFFDTRELPLIRALLPARESSPVPFWRRAVGWLCLGADGQRVSLQLKPVTHTIEF